MAKLVNPMANLNVADDVSSDSDGEEVIPFNRQLFSEEWNDFFRVIIILKCSGGNLETY